MKISVMLSIFAVNFNFFCNFEPELHTENVKSKVQKNIRHVNQNFRKRSLRN